MAGDSVASGWDAGGITLVDDLLDEALARLLLASTRNCFEYRTHAQHQAVQHTFILRMALQAALWLGQWLCWWSLRPTSHS